MATRVNTLWCEFDSTTEKPTSRECLRWILDDIPNSDLTSNLEDKIVGIQYDPLGFFIKFNNSEIAQNIIVTFNGESKIKKENGIITKIKIRHAGIGTRHLRILRLPFEMSNEIIIRSLSEFGDVIGNVYDEYWSEEIAGKYKRFKNGNRFVQCNLKKHIPSFINVQGIKALITYDGQPKTCAYCGKSDHLIANCERRIIKESNKKTYSSVLTNRQPSIEIENEFQQSPPPQNLEPYLNINSIQVQPSIEMEPDVQQSPAVQNLVAPPKLPQEFKRTYSSTDDPSDSEITKDPVQNEEVNSVSTPKKHQVKKSKTIASGLKEEINFEIHLEPIKAAIIENNFNLTYDILKDFLNEAQKSDDILSSAYKITKSNKKSVIKIQELLEILDITQKKVVDTSAKTIITKIHKSLTHEFQVKVLEPLSSETISNSNSETD